MTINFTEPEERLALRKAVGSSDASTAATTSRSRPGGRQDHRAVAGGRQDRLPRRQHPGGVRRRRWRHRRPRRGAARSWPRPAPAADDGRVAGDLRHDHHPVRHRRAEEALASRHRRRHHADRVRHHRGRRRLELAPDHHDRLPATATGAGGSTGSKTFISGVDEAESVLVVARTEDAKTGNLKPALFIVPTDAEGFTYAADRHGHRLAGEAVHAVLRRRAASRRRAGRDEDAGIGSCSPASTPSGSWAPRSPAARPARDREGRRVRQDPQVWKDQPIGAHQAIAHPLAKVKIELELARLMTQKAAALYAAGDHLARASTPTWPSTPAGEVSCNAVDRAVQTHGGNGLAVEYGLANCWSPRGSARIAPVSREMVLNFVAMHTSISTKSSELAGD